MPNEKVGPILFNYAYVVTLPSWVNEMKPGISVNKQIWGALIPGILCFVSAPPLSPEFMLHVSHLLSNAVWWSSDVGPLYDWFWLDGIGNTWSLLGSFLPDEGVWRQPLIQQLYFGDI